MHEPDKVIAEAVAAVEAGRVLDAPAAEGGSAPATKVDANAKTGTKIRQWLMTGVSYMIPFVAAGGILIAVAFMMAQIAWGGAEGAVAVTDANQVETIQNFNALSLQHWAVVLLATGQLVFNFLIPVLSGFIAYAIADRPGLVPGFLGGAASVMISAGFLGGLITGFLAGFVALWISRWKVPKGMRGIMPVVVIPLLSSLIVGIVTLVIIGRPIASAMSGMENWLEGLGGGSIVLLGVLLGAMMGADLGGPINKVAYSFGIAGLTTVGLAADASQYRIMAAVMAAGMVAPLGMALATVMRRKLFNDVERDNGKAAWLLGASFISEGAIPFAAADPWRVILSSIVGSGVTGGLIMAFNSTLVAPHGGVWVLPLIGNALGFLLAIIVGAVVCAVLVTLLKQYAHRKPANIEADAVAV